MNNNICKCFYCYIKKGKKVITETEPRNFYELKFHSCFAAPNKDIAERVYDTNLKLFQDIYKEV